MHCAFHRPVRVRTCCGRIGVDGLAKHFLFAKRLIARSAQFRLVWGTHSFAPRARIAAQSAHCFCCTANLPPKAPSFHTLLKGWSHRVCKRIYFCSLCNFIARAHFCVGIGSDQKEKVYGLWNVHTAYLWLWTSNLWDRNGGTCWAWHVEAVH
jgi:hypothetical protein